MKTTATIIVYNGTIRFIILPCVGGLVKRERPESRAPA